ncbi:MAG: TonB family protein [Acidobacteriota bacterium]|nr:TonB family protein [Acidobacteriota bacterium]
MQRFGPLHVLSVRRSGHLRGRAVCAKIAFLYHGDRSILEPSPPAERAGRVRKAGLFALSAVFHAVLVFAAFNSRGTYKIYDLGVKPRDAFLVPKGTFRYLPSDRISPGVPAESRRPGASPSAAAGAPSAAGSKDVPGPASGEAAGSEGGGGFKLVYPAADAKISLSQSAASIEDALAPPGLYRDYSKVDLSKAGGRGGGGGSPVVGQAVPRAKRQTSGSGVSIQLPGLDFKPWAGQVLNKIQKNWALPNGSGSAWKGEVGIRILVAKNGQVLGADLDAPTKIEILDQAALRAVQAAAPFPPLPAAYSSSSLEVYFVFRYGD